MDGVLGVTRKSRGSWSGNRLTMEESTGPLGISTWWALLWRQSILPFRFLSTCGDCAFSSAHAQHSH